MRREIKLLLLLYISFLEFGGAVQGTQINCGRVEYEEGLKACFITLDASFGTRYSLGISPTSTRDDDMRKLMITGNSEILYFPEYISKSFPNLEYFEAENFPLKTVPEDTYKNLTSLKKLRMNGNLVETIEHPLFRDLTALEILDLTRNQIRSISESALRGLTKLRIVLLDKNQIESIGGKLFLDLNNLENIHLENNQIRSIDIETFRGLSKLRELWLYKNHIKIIDGSLFRDLIAIKVLILRSNPFSELDADVFKGLRNLWQLELWENSIETIDINLFKDLAGLEKLYLRTNNLILIDDRVFMRLSKLKILELWENQIEVISGHLFRNLFELEILRLSKNKIKTLDVETFSGLRSLKHLWLDENQIESINRDVLIDLTALETLRLHKNKIKVIDVDAFKDLVKLKDLWLFENQIESIDNNLFLDLTALERLALNDNKIKSLNGEAFIRLKSLITVWLNDNDCIDDAFTGESRISLMFEIVTEKCGMCGKVIDGVGYVVAGRASVRGKWPFAAALYHLIDEVFFCGSTLISNQHALTAAHCIQSKFQVEKLEPEQIMVWLGRYNLSASDELYAVPSHVKSIHIHPDWNISTVGYDADIAILFLSNPIVFTPLIRPVCLPNDNIPSYDDGTVIGWGRSDLTRSHSGNKGILREVAVKAINDSACFRKDPDIASLAGRRGGTFCAGGENSGACSGDSGGGLFVQRESFWILRGIVSSGTLNKYKACDVSRVNIYTNVIDYRDWISTTTRKKYFHN